MYDDSMCMCMVTVCLYMYDDNISICIICLYMYVDNISTYMYDDSMFKYV